MVATNTVAERTGNVSAGKSAGVIARVAARDGVAESKAKAGFPRIALERTTVTGLKHVDGAVSMARGTPDSATSGWFICINDQPSLDFEKVDP